MYSESNFCIQLIPGDLQALLGKKNIYIYENYKILNINITNKNKNI